MNAAPWRSDLRDWYRAHQRDLPWRQTRDPYAIWVSEVMLQQTQVATVLPYYARWLTRFPTVATLASATEEEVLSLWQGLGYYRRAKLLLAGARWVAAHGWPTTREGWLKVPGVGPYTAAAIGSIAFGLPAAVVDGNVERVFARFTACDAVGSSLLRSARKWAGEVLDLEAPADWNQALMELGATVCTPRNPKCGCCPLEPACVARQSWAVERFPVRPEALAVRHEAHLVWIPYFEGRFGVRRIPEGEWWAGLWEFPRSATSSEKDLEPVVGEGWRESLGSVRHQVTQHRIVADIWLVRCESASAQLEWRPLEALDELPMPSPARKALRMARDALGL